MKLALIGCGCGRESRTAEADRAIREAELLIGPARLLREVPEAADRIEANTPDEMLKAAFCSGREKAAILLSGDSGFYSGARLLIQKLPKTMEDDVELIPGISSMQAFAARLREPWQGWRLCSAHGVECDPVSEVCHGKPAFFLTGGKQSPQNLCRQLTEAGLGFLQAAVGENLGSAAERIRRGAAEKIAEEEFAPLSVLLAEAAPGREMRTPGIPDECFLREKGIPMTKQDVRAVALAKLGVKPEDTCWDIGTGTGGIAVELALQAKRVYSVECDRKAMKLAEKNRKAFGAWNLRLIYGRAPEALKGLPKPDAVFIGGSGGGLNEILSAVTEANPQARICVSAVTIENLSRGVETMRALGLLPEITQLSVSRGHEAGGLTLMQAQNPVTLIVGRRA